MNMLTLKAGVDNDCKKEMYRGKLMSNGQTERPPNSFGGLQSEKGAGFLAGDVALTLPLPHHQRLQLHVVHR